jgi:hypothetical protein
MNRLPLIAALAASVAAGGLVAGCGGDSSPPPPPPPAPSNQMPTSAVASDAALEAFAIGQAPSETADPLLLDNVSTFPTSETEEPIAVN